MEWPTTKNLQKDPLTVSLKQRSNTKNAHPDGRFWLKADGCDLKVAVQEPVTAKWEGNVDLKDGKQQEPRAQYDARRAEASIQDGEVQRDAFHRKMLICKEEITSENLGLRKGF